VFWEPRDVGRAAKENYAAGGLLNLDNFRRREWAPAVDASSIARPARIYDFRSTFASNALAAGVPETVSF
jgi:hypothetical protein